MSAFAVAIRGKVDMGKDRFGISVRCRS